MDRKAIEISFIGRNNGFAIGMMNHINLIKVFIVTFVITLIPVTVFVSFGKYYSFYFFLFPFFFFGLSFLIFIFVKYDDNVFLSQSKKEHVFKIIDDHIYKDSNQIKLIKSIKVYKYRKFLFLETSHSYFVINNYDYKTGDREMLIEWIKKNNIKCFIGY